MEQSIIIMRSIYSVEQTATRDFSWLKPKWESSRNDPTIFFNNLNDNERDFYTRLINLLSGISTIDMKAEIYRGCCILELLSKNFVIQNVFPGRLPLYTIWSKCNCHLGKFIGQLTDDLSIFISWAKNTITEEDIINRISVGGNIQFFGSSSPVTSLSVKPPHRVRTISELNSIFETKNNNSQQVLSSRISSGRHSSGMAIHKNQPVNQPVNHQVIIGSRSIQTLEALFNKNN
jgi:hypothetical protein